MNTAVIRGTNSRNAQEAVLDTARRLIANGTEIGLQVVAYQDGRKIVDVAEGCTERNGSSQVTPDTLFPVFSVTKAVIVTCLHLQVDRGLIAYNECVGRYWPEYAVNGKEATTVRDIVMHRAGVPQMPEGIGPGEVVDWDLVTSRIATLTPLAPPGAQALYQALTYGWLVGELVRRTDPAHRPIGQFIRDELATPLRAPDLWLGLPDDQVARVAKLAYDIEEKTARPDLFYQAMPRSLALGPHVYEQPAIRRAGIPAVGGIFSAHSCARFWAMLAQGGELDGTRILSKELVETFWIPQKAEPDRVMYGRVLPLSIAGFWLGQSDGSTVAAKTPRAIAHPGAGNTMAWADADHRLAVAICHNRMYQPATGAENGALAIGDSIRQALNLG